MSDDAIYIGVNLPAKQGVSNQQIVDTALSHGYDLITSRITSSSYRKRVQALYACEDADPDLPIPIGSDLVILPGIHISNTIALCAPWTELDSKDCKIADLSYKVLAHEMAHACFCGLPYVVIEGPKRRTHLARYAHSLSKLLRRFPDLKVMLHTTFTEDFRDGNPPPDLLSTWDVWDGVRVMCGHPANLGVTLEVQNQRLPEFVVSRWLCEPIMMLILGESTTFVPNPKNYPVLPRFTQSIVRKFRRLHPFFLIKENFIRPSDFNGGDGAAQIYLRNLLTRPPAADPAGSRLSHASYGSRTVDAEPNRPQSVGSEITDISDICFCESYADVLETPLQPLSAGLDNSVYEVFETDEAKYNQYYLAILAALAEICGSGLHPSSLTIAVLGAGRGALVDRVLDALVSQRMGCPVTIYAIEKHAGPISYLHARKSCEPVWDSVQIVHTDMRSWIPPQPCQLIISELLGSFGDNELSPECIGNLAADSRVLDQAEGIMIPCSYTPYVAPIFSPQLWSKARAQGSLEEAYVVCLHQAECLAEPLPTWNFEHRRQVLPGTTRRHSKLAFRVLQRSRVYGFSGYFEATLFPGITLSTVPSSRTPKLTSWFPMFFPIVNPLDVYPDSQIDISIWRESHRAKCWYEWTVETSFHRMRSGMTSIHNSEGHAQSMSF